MLDRLEPQSPDALLALIKLHAADERSDKIDLGVGVYRTKDGDTPVFRAIKAAERRLVEKQSSKSYLGPEGDMGFVHALMPYVFGDDAVYGERIEGMQTPGGTGAVRLAVALAQRGGVEAVHLGIPSWPNHAQILADIGMETRTFSHARDDGTADIEAVLEVIAKATAKEAILLHACCHNPTGIDYTNDEWDRIADALSRSEVFPIIDSAYQGLGRGMEEDAYGLRRVLDKVEEAMIAYSCDKNFGMYRDRVGALYVMAKESAQLDTVMSNLNALARASWSMPPDHGAAAVREILSDPELSKDWLAEVEEMRERMREVRGILADAGEVGSLDLAPLGEQNGLFSVLPLDKDQIARLRSEHGIYMAGSGRINVAGLTRGNIDKFIGALADVAS
ncbi:aminotransferase class I/II-fold pyridoxal phosphate-dependent enzyme [Altererythrobacter aurantiacus]|uniref:Aminotransferase class I/II-fold pyridoxal phosphate-dependent enzyme n=1 Tax=Parapontixanthobacter aurantiacus TaxID=1463599 RepID=A0A844Z9I0_9SPHN|nr:aromatic amino acid transaminase [Parapontixanthobacter aurantiacus]MXO84468.1 aminotransferase class I/II-fold pyridoxal phosphate-dependent enzyme [Parapontixanthobacter aurantiacus]